MNAKKRSKLSSLSHHLDPLVFIGRGGVSDGVINSIEKNIEKYELIKVKFNDHKENKKELSKKISEKLDCELVKIIGHTLILYKENSDPEKRSIKV